MAVIQGLSIETRIGEQFASIYAECWNLMRSLDRSPRSLDLFGAPLEHQLVLSPLYEAAFRLSFATPKSIRNAVRGFREFLSFQEALDIDYMNTQ